jgi:hypothetical protein
MIPHKLSAIPRNQHGTIISLVSLEIVLSSIVFTSNVFATSSVKNIAEVAIKIFNNLRRVCRRSKLVTKSPKHNAIMAPVIRLITGHVNDCTIFYTISRFNGCPMDLV